MADEVHNFDEVFENRTTVKVSDSISKSTIHKKSSLKLSRKSIHFHSGHFNEFEFFEILRINKLNRSLMRNN